MPWFRGKAGSDTPITGGARVRQAVWRDGRDSFTGTMIGGASARAPGSYFYQERTTSPDSARALESVIARGETESTPFSSWAGDWPHAPELLYPNRIAGGLCLGTSDQTAERVGALVRSLFGRSQGRSHKAS